MTSDDEWTRFDAWCREEAADIRNHAAAHGETAEYRYLKREHTLRRMLQEKFPGISEGMIDFVERACYCDDIPLDLVKINEYRARWDYPPLWFVPTLKLREEYRPPMPSDVPDAPPPPVPGPTFHDWAIAKLIQVRYSAVAAGVDLERRFLEMQRFFINPIDLNFPDIGAARGLWLMKILLHHEEVTNAPLDMERIRGMRAWRGTLEEVAGDVEKLARGESIQEPPPLKS